jgi:uncharacterized membrane protein YeaQ/YmgE (transglycosylase-associated protein family)
MGLFAFLVLGTVVDLLARTLLARPAKEMYGSLPAVIAGAFAGGILVSLLGGADIREVRSENLLGSMAGALAVLAVTFVVGRRVGA